MDLINEDGIELRHLFFNFVGNGEETRVHLVIVDLFLVESIIQ